MKTIHGMKIQLFGTEKTHIHVATKPTSALCTEPKYSDSPVSACRGFDLSLVCQCVCVWWKHSRLYYMLACFSVLLLFSGPVWPFGVFSTFIFGSVAKNACLPYTNETNQSVKQANNQPTIPTNARTQPT